MKINYYMPAQIVAGDNCVRDNAALMRALGDKAFIITGSGSAKKNGSLDDSLAALSANKQSCTLFDKALPNPSIEDAYGAAEELKRSGCDFVLAIGGGSSIDLGKAAAVLACNDLTPETLFSTPLKKVLPIAAVPTTAGTGSEATNYSILTNTVTESKSSITSPLIIPRLGFLDARYTYNLGYNTTVNTALDALSHSVESLLSIKSSPFTEGLALSGIRIFRECLPALQNGRSAIIEPAVREKLLLAAAIGGMVIANTGTIIVHGMGYSLTYFKHIDHGRANGLLLGSYLDFVSKKDPAKIEPILKAMGAQSVGDFEAALNSLLGVREKLSEDEIKDFAVRAGRVLHLKVTAVPPGIPDMEAIYRRAVGGA